MMKDDEKRQCPMLPKVESLFKMERRKEKKRKKMPMMPMILLLLMMTMKKRKRPPAIRDDAELAEGAETVAS